MKRISIALFLVVGVAPWHTADEAMAGPAVGARTSQARAGSPARVPMAVSPAPLFAADFAANANSASGGEEEQEPTAPATIRANVPAGADLWVDGHKTSQTGAARSFITPPLQRGKTFAFEVRVHWTASDGTIVDLTRSVRVQAGRQTNIAVNGP